MTILKRLLPAIALALTLSVGSLAQAREPGDMKGAEQTLARGKLIYDYDQAAWHSSDVMVEKLPRTRLMEIRGWLVEPDGDALSVLYYGYEGETPYGVFRAGFKDGKVTGAGAIPADGPRALTPLETRMAQARKVAADSNPAACVERPFNTVIVPPASETAPVEVYLLTPQVKEGEYPFGLHYRVTVGADGKVASSRPFMKSCMNQPLPKNAVASMISHLLDPAPTEIHAWLARWTGKPVYVMIQTPSQLWEVTPTEMRKVDKPGK